MAVAKKNPAKSEHSGDYSGFRGSLAGAGDEYLYLYGSAPADTPTAGLG
jgi:hypothetical protein